MLLEWFIAASACVATAQDLDVSPPEKVDVLPVFFVPKGEALPTRDQKARLMRHLKWSQTWYRDALGDRDSFRIARTTPDVYRARHPLAFYKDQPSSRDASHFVGELLDHYRVNRFNCPHDFVIIIMNPREDYPVGGGRPVNGGFNRGCGLLVLSSYNLDKAPNFQSTLRHQLGHSFGLPHVEVYGYDMKTNPSFMSYNPGHHTIGFQDSVAPSRMIPEDIRGLALNRLCFARLKFDPAGDNPESQRLGRIVWLGPMEVVGQPPYDIEVTTQSGSTYGSKPIHVVQRRIDPCRVSGNDFNAASMWHSEVSESGRVALEVKFPVAVTLTKLGIHTRHSGQYHAAEGVRIQVKDGDAYRDVVEQDLKAVDAVVSMPPTRGTIFRVHLRAGKTKMVVVRGLRFFNESGEIFPPAVPYNGP